MNQQINDSFEVLVLIRKKFLGMIETLSLEQLNRIPSSFNNNLIWNIVHSLVSTDLLVYGPCGLDIPLFEWVDDYRKGSKPDPSVPVSAQMLEDVKKALSSCHGRLIEDFKKNFFHHYQSYQTQFGVALSNVEYGILYAIKHEMLHLGYSMALRRVVS